MTDAFIKASPRLPKLVDLYLRGDQDNAWPGKYAVHPPDATGHSEATNCEAALRHLLDTVAELDQRDDPRATRRGDAGSSRHLADLVPDQIRPSDIRHVQERMIRLGRARSYVNRCHQRIVGFFEWCLEYEYMSAEALRGVDVVRLIRQGRPGVVERPRVESVPEEVLEQTTACAGWLLRQAMFIQEKGVMRPGELVAMRVCDIRAVKTDDGVLWHYQPTRHKTKYRGATRIIKLGGEAQAALRKVVEYMYGQDSLLPDAPSVPKLGDESDTRRIWWRAEGGPTGRCEGWSNAQSYAKAIGRATKRAGVKMTANQIRKKAITEAYVRTDDVTAASLAGHDTPKTTRKVYIDAARLREKEGRAGDQYVMKFG